MLHLDTARQYTRRVPIYEYACMECESHFDELVRSSDQAVTCPECGAANVLEAALQLRGARRVVEAGVQRPDRQWRRVLRRLVRLRPLTTAFQVAAARMTIRVTP